MLGARMGATRSAIRRCACCTDATIVKNCSVEMREISIVLVTTPLAWKTASLARKMAPLARETASLVRKTDLSLDGNPITHKDDVHRLCEIVKEHPSIELLNLDGCCGEGINGYNMLCSVMTSGERKIKSIDSSSNNISTG